MKTLSTIFMFSFSHVTFRLRRFIRIIYWLENQSLSARRKFLKYSISLRRINPYKPQILNVQFGLISTKTKNIACFLAKILKIYSYPAVVCCGFHSWLHSHLTTCQNHKIHNTVLFCFQKIKKLCFKFQKICFYCS